VKPRQPSCYAKGCQFRQIYLEDEGRVARRGWHRVPVPTVVAVRPKRLPHIRVDILEPLVLLDLTRGFLYAA
jgi:hypothetical protein